MTETEAEALNDLRSLVEAHEVCWELHGVESKPLEGERVQVGYELVLAGIFNDPERADLPVRDKLDFVLASLRTLASYLADCAREETDLVVRPFESGMQASPRREQRPEASLKVGIFHKEGFQTPVDAHQTTVARALEAALKAVGARKGTWNKV